MDKNQMKNIIVLKNLPSNLIEEAIIVLKTNKIVKKLEFVEKKEIQTGKNKGGNSFIVKEAENVISNYISNIEKKDEQKENFNINKKYKRLKIYSIVVTGILFINFFI